MMASLLQSVVLIAIAGPSEASLEVQVRGHDRHQACPACCASTLPGSSIQQRRSGLRLGYHLHPEWHRLAVPGCRTRPFLRRPVAQAWRQVC
jgi:hypothetical protein